MMPYYPAFIDINGKECLVVGGGAVAERKVKTLVVAGAQVTVVSPTLTKTLQSFANKLKITYLSREYNQSDLQGKFIVIAATSNSALNAQIATDAPYLVNVVDNPKLSNFIVPSTFYRHPLAIAVSTSGTSPLAAKIIRADLQKRYGKDFIKYMHLLALLRQDSKDKIKDTTKRKEFLQMCVDHHILHKINTEGFKSVKQLLNTKLKDLLKT